MFHITLNIQVMHCLITGIVLVHTLPLLSCSCQCCDQQWFVTKLCGAWHITEAWYFIIFNKVWSTCILGFCLFWKFVSSCMHVGFITACMVYFRNLYFVEGKPECFHDHHFSLGHCFFLRIIKVWHSTRVQGYLQNNFPSKWLHIQHVKYWVTFVGLPNELHYNWSYQTVWCQ